MWDTSEDEKFYTHVHFIKNYVRNVQISVLDISDIHIDRLSSQVQQEIKSSERTS